MTSHNQSRNISQIETIWPVLMQAHGENPGQITAAQQAILLRYRPAVFRYLCACLGNTYDAEEVCQEFSLRLIRGDFRNADPEKGRFRDLLKTALYHLIIDYHKKKRKQMAQIGEGVPDPAAVFDSVCASDREFLATWRSNLLNQTWEALAEVGRETGQPLHTVLHYRAGNPEMRSAAMAESLSTALGKKVSAEWVRKWLHLGREKFAELLLREVAFSLHEPTPDAVEQELIDLELYQYCKPALDEWRLQLVTR
jgi:RNA polymerase sigma factor (sigma-70 family)